MKNSLLSLLILVSAASFAGTHGDLPGDSIYQLNVVLTSQEDKPIKLDMYRGQPVLITMFYGSCPNVCPLLFETTRMIERSLEPGQKSQLRVLMVSIDPDRDTPKALTKLAQSHHADLTRWTLARAGAADVRKIAAVLNIQYRKLPNGEFNHASVITLLDTDGRIVDKTSQLGLLDAAFVDSLKKTIRDR